MIVTSQEGQNPAYRLTNAVLERDTMNRVGLTILRIFLLALLLADLTVSIMEYHDQHFKCHSQCNEIQPSRDKTRCEKLCQKNRYCPAND